MRLAIVSDTHLPRRGRAIPAACIERMRGADAILHAGDFIEPSVLEDLRALGPPVYAVAGNVDAPELHVELHEEIERLPEKYRSPIYHFYLEGHSQEEVSRRLGWPLGTVQTRLHRGRERLRASRPQCLRSRKGIRRARWRARHTLRRYVQCNLPRG